MNKYIKEFLKIKCAGDVLNTVMNLGNKPDKEITESMATITKLRNIAFKDKNKDIKLYDLCAGNALTSVIASHLFPNVFSYAIDKRERKGNWGQVRGFEYLVKDIYDISEDMFEEGSVIIGVHPCGKLADRIIDLYNKSQAKYLIIMPCCQGKNDLELPKVIKDKIGHYLIWVWSLAKKCNGKITIDNSCLSPKNAIIIAEKQS